MDRRFVCTVLAVLAVTVGAALAARREPSAAAPLTESIAGVELPSEDASESAEGASPEEPAYAYIIREYEGRVAVFAAGNDSEPEMVLDTLVKFLPDYDRSQLEQGLKVKDYRELLSLIEDYIS